MKKILVMLFCALLLFSTIGCNGGENIPIENVDNQENQNNNEQIAPPVETKKETILTVENIEEYLKIYVSYEDMSVTTSYAFNPPLDKGTGKMIIETTALKRGDFEDVEIKLTFKSERGWGTEVVTITIPFDGNITEINDLLSYNGLIFEDPRFEMTISSVSGKFVQ